MGTARRKPKDRFHSIHLVPNEKEHPPVSADAAADPSSMLSLLLAPERSADGANSTNGEGPSGVSQERKPVPALNPAAVLRELFELLEDYAPAWYLEEHHERAVAALDAGTQ